MLRHSPPETILKARVEGVVSDEVLSKSLLKQSSHGGGFTHRLLSSSFLGVPYRILNINHKKELLRSLWVEHMTDSQRFMSIVVESSREDCFPVAEGLTSKPTMPYEAKAHFTAPCCMLLSDHARSCLKTKHYSKAFSAVTPKSPPPPSKPKPGALKS